MALITTGWKKDKKSGMGTLVEANGNRWARCLFVDLSWTFHCLSLAVHCLLWTFP